MKSFKKDFPKREKLYFDSSSKALPPIRSALNSQNLDYHNAIFGRARDQSSINLKVKQQLADYIGGDVEAISLLPNRDIAWNLVCQELSRLYGSALITWSEETSIFAPVLKNFEVEILESFDGFDIDHSQQIDVIVGSSIDPISGSKRNFKDLEEFQDKPLIIDGSYDLATTSINDYQADIIIADLAIDMLSPYSLAMIYVKNQDLLLENPFPSMGNVATFTEDKIIARNDSNRLEVGIIDYSTLEGLKQSMNFLEQVGKQQILHHKSVISTKMGDILADYSQISVVKTPFGKDPAISHLSISSDTSSHDLALLLDEIANIEVRSGRLCTHLAMSKLNVEDLIRISWHLHIDEEDVQNLKTGLDQILMMI